MSFLNSFLIKHVNKIAVIILLFFTTISTQLAIEDSATFDEVAHIGAAWSYVSELDYRLNPEHPPLQKLFAGIPLLVINPNFDTAQDFWQTIDTDYPGEYGQWSAGRNLLYGAGNDGDKVLLVARLGMILLAVGFGALIFILGKYLAGAPSGLLALLLFVLSPGILGHAHYVTTDIGAAFFIMLSLATFAQFLRHGTWRWIIVAGIAFGLAQSAKFSALLLIPLFALLLLIIPVILNWENLRNLRKTMRKSVVVWGKGLIAGTIGIATIWLIYAPFTVTMPIEVFDTLAQTRINPDMGIKYKLMQSAVTNLNQTDILRPFAAYIHGIAQVLSRVAGGNQITFFGTVTSDAPAGYFPIVYAIKETLPHIGFALLALFTFGVHIFKSAINLFAISRQHDLRKTKLRKFINNYLIEITLALFVLVYGYVSISGNLAIGYRHLFPIVPIIYLLSAITIARGITRLNKSDCGCANRLHIASVALLVFMVWEVGVNYPYYLSYFNQSVGGAKNGWQFVTDSNADWGQDLKRLDKWIDNYNQKCANQIAQNENHPKNNQSNFTQNQIAQNSNQNCIPINKIRVDYFGGDNPAIRLGDKFEPWWSSRHPIQSGWYAISVNTLQESTLTKNATTENSYLWLTNHTPIAQISTSIFVYYIDVENNSQP